MKKIITILVSISTLFCAFETWPESVIEKSLAGSVTAAPLEDVFAVNPANMRLDADHKVHVTMSGGIGNYKAQVNDLNANILGRVSFSDKIAVGTVFHYLSTLYSGQQITGQPIYSEMLGSLVSSVKLGKVGQFGLGLNLLSFSNPDEAHSGFDLNAGFLFMLGKLVNFGISGNNLITIKDSTEREINFGLAFKLKAVTKLDLVPILDAAIFLDTSIFNLKIGVAWNQIIPILSARIGCEFDDNFGNILPALGLSLDLNKVAVIYGTKFNIELGGAGCHDLGVSLKF